MGCSSSDSISVIKVTKDNKLYFQRLADRYNIIFTIKTPFNSSFSSLYKKISEEFYYNYLSTKDILENISELNPDYDEIKNDIKVGSLINSNIIIKVLKNSLLEIKNNKNVLIDGFPRNLQTLKEWEEQLNGIVFIKRIFYINFNLDEIEKQKKELIEKNKNNEEKLNQINNQLKIFNDETIQVIDELRNRNLLVEIEGIRDENTVYDEMYAKFIENKLF